MRSRIALIAGAAAVVATNVYLAVQFDIWTRWQLDTAIWGWIFGS